MKTRLILSLTLGVIFSTSAYSQQKTALQSNGTTTIFDGATHFTDAYNAANNGDTIYLPGGLITSVPTVNKKLIIFGAGFHPDSTSATLQTSIASLLFQENADSSYVTGINFTDNLSTSTNHSVNYLTVTRCSFFDFTFNGNQTNPCTNVTLKENIIKGDLTLSNAQYCTVSNNISEGRIINGLYNAILNNIFLNNGYYSTISNVDNSMLSNNVFFKISGAQNITNNTDNSTFSNNIFRETPIVGTNTFIDNFYNVDITTVFVNQSGNLFDFTHDYHLVNPATYQGSDNTNIGIYGGLFPYKDGTLPQNPHIRSKNIATQTDNNGDLNIQINVAAQDN
jgi:hypothetical protein